MGKITKVALTASAKALGETAAKFNEMNDCVVHAVSIATDTDYETVHAKFTEAGRASRRRTQWTITQTVIAKLGYGMTAIVPSAFIRQYPKPHCWALKHVTTHHPRRFNAIWNDGNTYLFHCRGHLLAVKGGEVHDWSINNLLRVKTVYRVVKL